MKVHIYDESRKLIASTEVAYGPLLKIGDVIFGVLKAPWLSVLEVTNIISTTEEELHVIALSR